MQREKWKSDSNQERYKEDTDRLCVLPACLQISHCVVSLKQDTSTVFLNHLPVLTILEKYRKKILAVRLLIA